MTLAERIIQTCRTIACNCVPYAVDGDTPVHLPPLNEVAFLDWKNPQSGLAREFAARGAATDAALYDIAFIGRVAGPPAHVDELISRLKPAGKVYAIIDPERRNKTLSALKAAGLTIIDERDVGGEKHVMLRPPRVFPQPAWSGQPAASLLVHSPGGFGDDICAARYVPLLKEKVGHVVFEARPEMRSLLAEVSGYDRVISKGQPAADCEYQVCAFDLIKKYGPNPAETYLRRPAVTSPLDPAAHRVGIVYEGHHVKYLQRRRFRPSALRPFLRLPADLYCLQKHSNPEEFFPPLPDGIIDVGYRVTSWLDTARLVAQMDFVVSPDTSMFHLAGAMGVPTLLCMEQSHSNAFCRHPKRTSDYYPDAVVAFWGGDAMTQAANYIGSLIH